MKSCLSLILSIIIACVSTTMPLQAGYFMIIDVDPANGFQSSRTVNVGDTVTANLFLNLTDASDLSTYNFDLRYSPSHLKFESRSETANNLPGFFSLSSDKSVDEISGFAKQFDGVTFNPAGVKGPFTNPIQIASISFTAISTGESTIQPGNFDPLFNIWNTANGSRINTSTIVFGGATITAVPEPSTLILVSLAASSMGAAAWRKRKRLLTQTQVSR